MADDTLSPVRYESPIVKTRMSPRDRYALALALSHERTTPPPLPAAFLRHVIQCGLEHLGWTEEKIIKEYAEFEVACLRNDLANPYESE
jgi:hypothetical protein